MNVVRPTKSNDDNFDDNYDFNGKVIVIGLRVNRFDNFMPRVMRKRLRVNFHNFDDNFAHVARDLALFFKRQAATACRSRRLRRENG